MSVCCCQSAKPRLLVLLVLFAVVPGCGPGDGLAGLTGQVTFDGAPIPEGRIQFHMQSGDQKAFVAPIVDGRYDIRLEPGPAKVEIRASRPVPGKVDRSNPGEEAPMGEMYIPEKYNSRTELSVNVGNGTTESDFDLVK